MMMMMNLKSSFALTNNNNNFNVAASTSSPILSFSSLRFASSTSSPSPDETHPHTRAPPTAPFPHPEELIDAVLDFVRLAKEPPPADQSIPALGTLEERAIARLDSILFYEGYVPDTEKFRVVRALVYFPSIRKNTYLLPALHHILSLLIPPQIFRVLKEVDEDPGEKFQDRETMEAVEEFFGSIIEGKETDEEISNRFQELQRKVKAISTLASFRDFVKDIDKLIAQSQTAAAITDACLEYDPHGYGRIKAFEMRLALKKALPVESFASKGGDGSVTPTSEPMQIPINDNADENAADGKTENNGNDFVDQEESDAAALKQVVIDEIMLDVAAQTEPDGYVAYQHLRKL